MTGQSPKKREDGKSRKRGEDPPEQIDLEHVPPQYWPRSYRHGVRSSSSKNWFEGDGESLTHYAAKEKRRRRRDAKLKRKRGGQTP